MVAKSNDQSSSIFNILSQCVISIIILKTRSITFHMGVQHCQMMCSSFVSLIAGNSYQSVKIKTVKDYTALKGKSTTCIFIIMFLFSKRLFETVGNE